MPVNLERGIFRNFMMVGTLDAHLHSLGDSKLAWIGVKRPPPQRGVAGVLYYRLYYFDRFSGHIDHFREFEAADDGAAVVLAEQWSTGGPMELWNRERRLKRWKAQGAGDDKR